MEDILYNKMRVRRFINSPVPSNAYLIIDETDGHCIAVDPGSKEQTDMQEYILSNHLILDFIFLTHEHFDHCWGVVSLQRVFPAKIVATRLCAEWVQTPMNYFNKLYFDSNEMFSIPKVDVIAEEVNWNLKWGHWEIGLIDAKGHTNRGMCISIEKTLFSGDTMILNTKPFLKKKYGASIEDLKKTIACIYHLFDGDTIVYPGHGDSFKLKEMQDFYEKYFKREMLRTVC